MFSLRMKGAILIIFLGLLAQKLGVNRLIANFLRSSDPEVVEYSQAQVTECKRTAISLLSAPYFDV
jgi:hypothetical protein